MKHPDADTILQLIKKLEKQNDISLEEADWIYSLLSGNMLRTKLNSRSVSADCEFMNALADWFNVVAEKIEQGRRGNFIFTIILVENLSKSLPKNIRRPGSFIYKVRENARKNLEKYGRFEDLFAKLTIDRKIYSALPEELQKLFVEETKDQQYENFYVLYSPRAGMYHYPIKTPNGIYTIAKFMEGFVPVMKTNNYDVGNVFFGTVYSAYSALLDSRNPWYVRNINKNGIFQCVIAAYMKYKELPCVTMLRRSNDFTFVCDGDFIFFTEKDKAKTIKEALKISLEEIIKHALDENAIDKRTLESILYKDYVIRFPAEKFIETSVRYIDSIIQRKKEWETARKAIKDEDEWLEETR